MKRVLIKGGWVLERGDDYVEMHVPTDVVILISKALKTRAMDLTLMCRPDMLSDTINQLRDVAFAIDTLLEGK